MRALLIALLIAAAPAAAQEYIDPTLWQRATEFYLPAENPSGMTGAEKTGDGNIGRADLLYWSWNLPGYAAVQIPPQEYARDHGLDPWHTVDVTRCGVPRTARWVHITAMNIMTPGAIQPAMYHLYRAYGSHSIDPGKYILQVYGARLPSSLTVPLGDGKFQFLWHQAFYPSPTYTSDGKGGSTYGQHIFIDWWAR